MSNEDVGRRVRVILTERLGVRPEQVCSKAILRLNLGEDSLSHVEICQALEKEFELEISTETWEKVTTVRQAIDLVEKLSNAKAVSVS